MPGTSAPVKKFLAGEKNAESPWALSGHGSSLRAQLIASGVELVLWQARPGRYASKRRSLRRKILPRASRGSGVGERIGSDCTVDQRWFENSWIVTALRPSTRSRGGLFSTIATPRIGSACETRLVGRMVMGGALVEATAKLVRGVETSNTLESFAPA